MEKYMKNPYLGFIRDYAKLSRIAKGLPQGGFQSTAHPPAAPDAPKALLFSPHPDDESIIGALALRLLRERGMNVINVAVTQGSNHERQAARLQELRDACAYLGFGLLTTVPGGLEKISPKGRAADPANWAKAVEVIAGILSGEQPKIVFFPHEADWNGTHIGTHHLVVDAMKSLGEAFTTIVVETEFWAAMPDPNLMVESGVADVADMVAAISCHIGEVRRNPYHLTLPAWMQDNVRRGGELVGGQGGAAPDFAFATLYRLRRWAEGGWQGALAQGVNLPKEKPADVLGLVGG